MKITLRVHCTKSIKQENCFEKIFLCSCDLELPFFILRIVLEIMFEIEIFRFLVKTMCKELIQKLFCLILF